MSTAGEDKALKVFDVLNFGMFSLTHTYHIIYIFFRYDKYVPT